MCGRQVHSMIKLHSDLIHRQFSFYVDFDFNNVCN